jgi:hypothetical protein
VVLDVVEYVQDQLEEVRRRDGDPTEPERLLLVGGLCGSQYLQLRLGQAFGDKASLIVPTEPWAAVLHGAVHFGYDPSTIRSRIARYTYGTGWSDLFRKGIDPDGKKETREGVEYCKDRFRICVREGAAVEYDEVVVQQFIPVTSGQTEMTLPFYRTLDQAPEYVDAPGCEPLGDVTVVLGTAMDLLRPQRAVRVRFRFGGTQIEVTAVNVHTKQEYTCELRFHATY